MWRQLLRTERDIARAKREVVRAEKEVERELERIRLVHERELERIRLAHEKELERIRLAHEKELERIMLAHEREERMARRERGTWEAEKDVKLRDLYLREKELDQRKNPGPLRVFMYLVLSNRSLKKATSLIYF